MRTVSWIRHSLAAGACSLALATAGCGAWRPTTVPMRVVEAPAGCAVRPDTLLLLLPGSYSLPEDFEREGFVAAMRERHLSVDVALVDAHVGYYREHSIVERLRVDVIEPARARGYRRIWIGGISIGGLGAMLYSASLPGSVDGVIAIAPYLGSPDIARAVRAAGGLSAWQPAESAPPVDDLDQSLWRWLHERALDRSGAQPLFLGYGRADRFVFNDQVLAAALPAADVFTADGGHDWPVWQVLWQQMLRRLPLPVDASCTAG